MFDVGLNFGMDTLRGNNIESSETDPRAPTFLHTASGFCALVKSFFKRGVKKQLTRPI